MDRSKKPAAIGVGASLPQPTVSFRENIVEASLPTGESVTVHLFGATVTSWKLASGEEQLFLSDKAHLDGSKAIRGGIPVVFPVFGPPPPNHATSSLPQHGFARSCYWEFLGKSSSESLGKGDHQGGDGTVMLDFGLSHTMLGEDFRKAWPHEFGLVYTVTLAKNSLQTSLKVQNEGRSTFEFQDISTIRVKHLESKTYIDKTQDAAVLTESSPAVAIDKETDRIYQSLDPTVPIVVATEDGQTVFSLTRESLSDVVLWNPWVEKAKGMADFGPAEAYKNMICVEAGSVVGWQLLDTGDSWEGGQTVRARM